MNQPKEDTRRLAPVYIHTSSLTLMTVLSAAGKSLVCLAFYENRILRKAKNLFVLYLSLSNPNVNLMSNTGSACAGSACVGF